MTGFRNLLSALPPWLRPRQPPRDWKIAVFDPDGMPGDVYLLDIDEVARLVTWLRQRSDRTRGGASRLLR